jgi:hypothetical protein
MAYPTRIRIRNVSDTRYGCFLKYPCFVACIQSNKHEANKEIQLEQYTNSNKQ